MGTVIKVDRDMEFKFTFYRNEFIQNKGDEKIIIARSKHEAVLQAIDWLKENNYVDFNLTEKPRFVKK